MVLPPEGAFLAANFEENSVFRLKFAAVRVQPISTLSLSFIFSDFVFILPLRQEEDYIILIKPKYKEEFTHKHCIHLRKISSVHKMAKEKLKEILFYEKCKKALRQGGVQQTAGKESQGSNYTSETVSIDLTCTLKTSLQSCRTKIFCKCNIM